MRNGTDVKKAPEMLSVEKQAELAGYITTQIIKGSSVEQVDYWLGKKKELAKNLKLVFSLIPEDEYSAEREEWKNFYKTQFDWIVDFSQVIVPVKPEVGNWRLIFIAKGMTMNLAFDKASKLFPNWRYKDDLDKAIPANIRNTQNSYAIWVKDGVEPDVEFLGKSTREADPDMKLGITVLEGIILEMKYFLEIGNHLNVKGVTFCSGSRSSDGNVPCLYWSSVKFSVYWYFLGNSDSDYGIRLAVKL
jgi:hypothetical protein